MPFLENGNSDKSARSKATVNADDRWKSLKVCPGWKPVPRLPHQRDETRRTCQDVTCPDVKRSEAMQRTVASCNVASCYVRQSDAIRCRATSRKGPPPACEVCRHVAFPSVFFPLLSQASQSYSSDRDLPLTCCLSSPLSPLSSTVADRGAGDLSFGCRDRAGSRHQRPSPRPRA